MVKRLLYFLTLLVVVLLSACSDDTATDEVQQPLPEGMGRIRITICTPEKAQNTRAVNVVPWEDPDHDWERLQNFSILICKEKTGGKYEVVQVISGTGDDLTEVAHTPEENEGKSISTTSTHKSATVTSDPLRAGDYFIFATANFLSDDDYEVGDEVDPELTVKYSNGYSEEPIHMTGKLDEAVTVTAGSETDAGTLTVWRVMAKMQFEFTNESDTKIRIIGIEVDPINLASENGPGIYLFSKDNLESTENLAPGVTPPTGKEGITLPPAPSGEGKKSAREDVGTFRYQPTTIPLTLDAASGTNPTGTIFFYVNESDGTFTTTQNQYSLRFKVQRLKAGKSGENADDWYEQEIRYGVTTHHDLTDAGDYGGNKGGFNVIRRNDWIHIPIVLTDWQFRIEPLAFVPIAGYPAKTMSSDGLTATFNTGGMIILQPFVKKYNDKSWRDFSNAEVTFESVSWKNSDEGDSPSGTGKILLSPFTYDTTNNCLVGELNNNLSPGTYKTTVTVNVQLGPQPDPSIVIDDQPQPYSYSFTFNIVLTIPAAGN